MGDFTGVKDLLDAAGGGFPAAITAPIELGGKGRKANGEYQTHMSDSYKVEEDGTVSDSAKTTYEDIDGFEWVAAAGAADGYFIVQEDGGNDFGERTFIAEARLDGTPMTYYFIAMSGGDDNTRMLAGVGVPAGTNIGPGDI